MTKYGKLFLSLLLVLTMLLMAACSGDARETTPETEPETTPQTTGQPDGDTQTSENGITLEKTVVYESGGVTVTATGYDEDGLFGPEISFLVANHTEEEIMVTTSFVAVNGYMMPYTSLTVGVEAGNEATEYLCLTADDLETFGIEQVAKIQFGLLVVEPESWETLGTSDRITLTTSAGDYVQNVDDSGEVVYDEDGVRIVSKGLRQDELWEGALMFYMENHSGQDISVFVEDVFVNDAMVTTAMWTDVVEDTRIIDGMYLMDTGDIIVEDLSEIETVAFTLRIANMEDQTEIAVSDQITLTFSENAE